MHLIIGQYRITSDERNIIVEERKIAKSGNHVGEETWANAAYFNNLLQACQAVLRRHISKSEACDLGQVIAAVERAERDVVQAVREATLVKA